MRNKQSVAPKKRCVSASKSNMGHSSQTTAGKHPNDSTDNCKLLVLVFTIGRLSQSRIEKSFKIRDTFFIFIDLSLKGFLCITCVLIHIADEGDKTSGDDDTNKILKEMHNMLHVLMKRVEGTEKELKSMKVRLSTPSSDSSSAKEKTVPLVVKVSDRYKYVLSGWSKYRIAGNIGGH